MQTAGQYRLQVPLSSCQVGDVWSGTDERGGSVTVAVLNERAAADDRWRDAFAAAADALAGAGADQLPIVGEDHQGTRPWVACAAERGAGAAQIFEALGQHMQPAAAQTSPAQAGPAYPAVAAATAWSPVVPSQGGAPTQGGNISGPGPATEADGPTQAVPAQPVPTQGDPAGSDRFAPTQAAPAQSAAGSAPTQALPIQSAAGSAPTQALPIQFAPESAPTQALPIQAAPESAPTQALPIQGAPAQGLPFQSAPARPQPVQPGPGPQGPVQPGPGQPAPVQPGPAAQPASDHGPWQPVQARPAPEQTLHQHPHPAQSYPASGSPVSGHPEPGYPASAAPTSGYPSSAAPTSGYPVSAAPTSGYPVSGSPTSGYPVSAAPTSGYPVSGSPTSGYPVSGGYPPYPPAGPQPPAKRKRTALLVTLIAIAGLLAGGGAAIAVTTLGDKGDPPVRPTPTVAAPLAPADLLLPATAPTAPGVEPPLGGGWPSGWPTFTSAESTKPMNGLEGVGFDFRVPPTWSCTKAEQGAAAVHYRCGVGSGATLTSGGDLVVRTCEQVCDERRRTALRQREEAWGVRWTRSGPFTTWAQTTRVDGKPVYGLVYVAFWRSTPEGEIDRELVLRLTAPLATSDELKKVANSVRDRTFTL
jgi:hypothetical protein